MISSWRRLNAFTPPSPYSNGMLMSKRPIRQYAMSSARVVSRLDAHDILSATKKLRDLDEKSSSVFKPIPVDLCTTLYTSGSEINHSGSGLTLYISICYYSGLSIYRSGNQFTS